MSLPFRISLLLLIILTGLLLAWGVVWAAPAMQMAQAVPTPTHLPVQPAVDAPDISFIDSPSAACSVAKPNTGVCYLSWNYLYATASPNYMITMTVEIDGKHRARYSGFFQTEMYIPSEMLVFQVPCGAPGASGNPQFGLVHNYTLRGRDSAGSGSANYGSAFCPADEPRRIYLPLLKR